MMDLKLVKGSALSSQMLVWTKTFAQAYVEKFSVPVFFQSRFQPISTKNFKTNLGKTLMKYLTNQCQFCKCSQHWSGSGGKTIKKLQNPVSVSE
jgi:hypothetical protein